MFFEKIPILEYSLYQMSFIFLFWGVIGWMLDVIDVAVMNGEYSNRGFLSMPLCPIYGFGVIIINVVLRPVADRPFALFFFSMIICTAFELLVGIILKVVFHNKWWDYSNQPFNFMGYICLKNSIFWGVGCVLMVNFVEPYVEGFADFIPVHLGIGIICVMGVLIAIDTVNSVAAVNKLNLRLKEISEISKLMYDNAQVIGKKIADTAITAAETGTNTAGIITEKTTETQKMLKSRYDALIAFSDKNVARLIRAFPKMRSMDYHDALEILKDRVLDRRKKDALPKSDSEGSDQP